MFYHYLNLLWPLNPKLQRSDAWYSRCCPPGSQVCIWAAPHWDSPRVAPTPASPKTPPPWPAAAPGAERAGCPWCRTPPPGWSRCKSKFTFHWFLRSPQVRRRNETLGKNRKGGGRCDRTDRRSEEWVWQRTSGMRRRQRSEGCENVFFSQTNGEQSKAHVTNAFACVRARGFRRSQAAAADGCIKARQIMSPPPLHHILLPPRFAQQMHRRFSPLHSEGHER